jgi:P27 family predicted phage terminase small subunit
MGGRNPRPKNLSELAGNRRALARNSVEMPLAIPVSPPWLTDEAKNEWDQIVPVLVRMRVLTEADQIAVAMLADYLARWKLMGERIKQFGYIQSVKDKNGKHVRFIRSPHITMHLEFGIVVQRLLSQFGLTPSARARLSEDGKKEQDNIFSRIAAIQED